jgi:hypothetical protein
MTGSRHLSLVVCAFIAIGALAAAPAHPASAGTIQRGAQIVNDIEHDVSPPLWQIASPPEPRPFHLVPLHHFTSGAPARGSDHGQPGGLAAPLAASQMLSFEGLGQGVYGFNVDAAPPDPNGSVGGTQYVQWVNESYAVFDKATGALILGPAAGNSLWAGMNNGCATNNDGDPIVVYDKAAGRWVMTQFSVSTRPYLQCVAVSDTSDATGTFERYAFPMASFPDYGKLGVWTDAYYMSWNMFNSNSFIGAQVCALDRTAMLNGLAASSECFQLSAAAASLLPADLDGATPPPTGAPGYFMNLSGPALNLYALHADFGNPAKATLSGPSGLPVAPYSFACNGGACIPQAGTKQQLDSLGDRLMYRLAYRNFGDHESLVANHSVNIGAAKRSSKVGVRWYEVRNPSGTPVVYQQGTYSPDSNYRWMGSIAMDKAGDIALGYSVSSSLIHPKIAYTGRVPGDAAGMLESETTVINGGGSQTKGLNRWGDYSAMSIDPVDDCTFYYTNEYIPVNGAFNWRTRVVSFKFPGC